MLSAGSQARDTLHVAVYVEEFKREYGCSPEAYLYSIEVRRLIRSRSKDSTERV